LILDFDFSFGLGVLSAIPVTGIIIIIDVITVTGMVNCGEDICAIPVLLSVYHIFDGRYDLVERRSSIGLDNSTHSFPAFTD
jgi:hypothetical protein